jgi:calmodulin
VSSTQQSLVNMNEEEVSALRDLFHSLDHKASGEIDRRQCTFLFRLLAIPLNHHSKLATVIDQFDEDKNGRINFDQFLCLLSRKIDEAHQANIILETFKRFDKDKDGRINLQDLSKIFFHLGERRTRKELNEMLSSIDYDQDGYVTYADFAQMASRLESMNIPQ